MSRLVAVMTVFALCGCKPGPQPMETSKANQGQYEVVHLFTHDGCKVYRFYDRRERYFVKCDNGGSRTAFDDKVVQRCGKHQCAKYFGQEIETVAP